MIFQSSSDGGDEKKNTHPNKEMFWRWCAKINQYASPLHRVNLSQWPQEMLQKLQKN